MPRCLVDTREQTPYRFPGAIFRKLDTGDYSLDGFESQIAVERKGGLSDLWGVVGRGRARFERELERLALIRYRAIVLETDIAGLLAGLPQSPPAGRRVQPAHVIGSIVSWALRYQIPIFLAGSRPAGAALTLAILRHAWQQIQEEE